MDELHKVHANPVLHLATSGVLFMLKQLDVEDYVDQLEMIFNTIRLNIATQMTVESITGYSNLHAFCQNLRNQQVAQFVCSHPKVEAIRPRILSMYAEWCYLREMELAKKIVAANDAKAAFKEYCTGYLRYKRIVDLEYGAVGLCASSEPRHALMIGSGPISSTAMVLYDHGMSVDCVDISEEANELSRNIIDRFGMSDRVGHITSDALELKDLCKYDVIWVAGFVGVAKMKSQILGHLSARARPGAFLIIRSAPTPCNLLYTEVRPWELTAFEQIMHLQPLSFNDHSAYIVQQPLSQ